MLSDVRGEIVSLSPEGEAAVIADLSSPEFGLQSAADLAVDEATGNVLVPDLFGQAAYTFMLP